jgi:pSer/pThr/pTyr-binding forkhead associated (FHA) protein
MFKLVIQDDEGKTTVVPLVRDEITIGRKEGNTIRLTERNVSRKHARISRANGAVAIEDLGSYNGVRVNGTRISQRTVLAVSDRVQIGDYLIELKAEGVEQPVNYEDARTVPIERIDPAQLAAAMPSAVPPAVPMGLADTDPTQRAVAPQAMAAAGPVARLVVLSSNFAGREFPLTKTEMVIGRTDDNDVVINHRSISRNHAKVVREPSTGRYTIMDLQSSNGVRVNGEDYGKVELRRGDTVDLGHVRFRFVDAGEDFVFGRDAQIADVPTGKSKSWLFALLGLVVVGGVVVVVASSGGGGKKKPDAAASQGGSGSGAVAVAPAGSGGGSAADVPSPPDPGPPDPGTGSGTGVGTGNPAGNPTGGSAAVAPPDPGPPDPGPGTGPGPAVATGDVGKLIADARAAINANDWAEASNLAAQAQKADPGNTEARALASQAKDELASQIAYNEFSASASRKQYDDAIAAFERIPTQSVYKNKARDGLERLHNQYTADVKAKAQSLAKARKCRDLERLANDAAKLFSDAAAAVRAVPCEEQVASKPPGGGDPNPGGSDPGPSGGDPAALIDEASKAALNGQWALALARAEETLRSGPSSAVASKAINIAALSACRIKKYDKAKVYYNKAVSQQQRTSIRQACLQASGSKFDPGA